MKSQLFFQGVTLLGIILTGIGSFFSYWAGEQESKRKEAIAERRIDELQEALRSSVEQNASMVNQFTKKVVDENTKKQMVQERLQEARRKLDEARARNNPQQRALRGH